VSKRLQMKKSAFVDRVFFGLANLLFGLEPVILALAETAGGDGLRSG
jgi:hypothetical protein